MTILYPIEQINLRGEVPFVYKIAHQLRVSKILLYRYPGIRQLLPTKSDTIYSKHVENIKNILEKIDLISNELIHQESLITYSFISCVTDISVDTLLYYVEVQNRVEQLKQQQLAYKEEVYLQKLDLFTKTDYFKNSPLKRTILEHLHLSKHILKNYPLLGKKIRDVVKIERKTEWPAFVDSKEKILTANGEEIKIFIIQS